MSKSEDMHLIRNLRCPYCQSPVMPIWNLKSTGMVRCMNRCGDGDNLKPEECVDVSEEEIELGLVEDLEDVKTEEE